MKYFLSYSATDSRRAEEIALSLRNLGHTVFFDRHSLSPGDEYDLKIRSEVMSSDRFIFLVSEHSLRGGAYTLTELKHAQQKWPHPKQRVLAVLLDDTAIADIPPYLTAATVLRPAGNVSAEVTAFIAQLDEVDRRLSRGRVFALVSIVLAVLFAGATVAYFRTHPAKTPIETAKDRLTARVHERPGYKSRVYPQFGFGFSYPAAWQVEDAAAAFSVPDIDVIQRYTEEKAAIGLEFRLLPIQPNYVNDFAAEVANQADVYRRLDPDLVVEDATIDGLLAKKFRYTQSTGKRRGDIQLIWVRLAPQVKLQIISFTYTDEPDRDAFLQEARRVIDSLAIDRQILLENAARPLQAGS